MLDWFIQKAYAYTIDIPIAKNADGTDKTTYTNFTDYFLDLVRVANNIATSIAVLMIVYGAFKYVTSGGDEAKARDGKDIIVGALVGLALLLLIRVLVPLLGLE
jgi:hypothetical protein